MNLVWRTFSHLSQSHPILPTIVRSWQTGLIAQFFVRSYQICTNTTFVRSYFGLWESRNPLLILGVFHFRKLGKNSTNLNHHFSSIFKGTMAWISINTKLFQTQIWLEKWYENGEILHFVSSFENGLGARSSGR